MGKVDLKIDSAEFLDSLETYNEFVSNQLKNTLKTCALGIERDAKRKCPVDTGRLRGSISTDLSQINSYEATIGTNVEYAVHVEYGTYKQSAKPYLRPAYNQNVNKLTQELKQILGGK